MIKNKTSIERQLDDRLYQFLIPFEGNWNEVLTFANEIAKLASQEIEKAMSKVVVEKIPEPEEVKEQNVS